MDRMAERILNLPRTMRTLAIMVVSVVSLTLWFTGCSTQQGAVSGDASARQKYDRELKAAVKSRWHDLLETVTEDGYQSGDVVVTFKLHANGSVTEVKIQENSSNEHLGKLCQQAVLDRAPYKSWPPEMQSEVGDDSRVIKFTFFYQ